MEKAVKRVPMQSMLFILQDCIDSLDSLRELSSLHKSIYMSGLNDIKNLPITPRLIPSIITAVRDHICIRLRNLFDPRDDSYSLKEFYNQNLIKHLKKHKVISISVSAANKNIAHLGKEYAKWPSVEDLLNSDIKEILESIKFNLFTTR